MFCHRMKRSVEACSVQYAFFQISYIFYTFNFNTVPYVKKKISLMANVVSVCVVYSVGTDATGTSDDGKWIAAYSRKQITVQ